uniref:Uncharacterized protein n=1 Tax=Arundo donax TaxID=35708 RepID=A0A0A9DYD7_ARUDO
MVPCFDPKRDQFVQRESWFHANCQPSTPFSRVYLLDWLVCQNSVIFSLMLKVTLTPPDLK